MTGPVGRRVSSNMRAAAFEYFATSSMATVRPRMPAPAPPYSSGMHRPVSPVSTNWAYRSSGYFSVSSISRARGARRSCASLRTVAWSSASSSESSKSTTGDATGRCRCFGPALRGLAPLADETTALALGPTTPHAVLLAHGKGVLEAWLAHRRSEEHTSELQSQSNLVCRLLLEKKKKRNMTTCQNLY